MKNKPKPKMKSECCGAKVRTDMSPDFPGDDPKTMRVGTCSFICLKCGKPCDLQKPDNRQNCRLSETRQGLCFRCENRAVYLESGLAPRYECGDITCNKYSCYCYKPIKPVVLKRNKGDSRPMFAPWMFSARSHFVAVADDLRLDAVKTKKGYLLLWKKK